MNHKSSSSNNYILACPKGFHTVPEVSCLWDSLGVVGFMGLQPSYAVPGRGVVLGVMGYVGRSSRAWPLARQVFV